MRRRQPSVAACRLRPLLSARCAKRDLARALGVPQQYVWNWLSGHSRPPEQHRATIEERFGIARDDWKRVASFSERRALAKAAA